MAHGTKLRTLTGANGWRGIAHWCPGCEEVHSYTISRQDGVPGPCWTFNGDFERPSFSPSMLIFVTETEDENEQPLSQPVRRTLCHYFIKTGADLQSMEQRGLDPSKSYIEFCGDSPHKLSGQTVELPDWPYKPGEYGGIDE